MRNKHNNSLIGTAIVSCTAVLAVILITFICSAAQAAKPRSEGIVLPPSQVGPVGGDQIVTVDVFYNGSYSIDELYERSEAFALITVGNWVCENDSCTYFEATADRTYKGSLPERFLIYQMGASGGVITGSPLFTYGDKLLVGLISRSIEGFEDAYEIVGADTAFFYAAQVDGETYLIDHKGIMTRRTFAECGDAAFTNQAAGNPGLAKRILNELGKNDKAIAAELEAQGGISFVYSLNELEQRMG